MPSVSRERSVNKASGAFAAHPASALDCAQSRKNRHTGESPTKKFVCRRWIMPERHETRQLRDTKSPRGRNASRAWLVAYAPTEFSNPVLADPKARFCRSLATRQRDSSLTPGYPGAFPGNPLTLRHLIQALIPHARVLGTPLAYRRLRALLPIPDTSRSDLPIPAKRNDPERRATSIVARPGFPCKSRAIPRRAT